MHVKLTLLSAACALAILPATAETRTYDLASFDTIDASRVVDIVYVQGNTQSVTIDVANGDFSKVDVSVRGGTLTVTRPRQGSRWGSTNIRERNGQRIIKINGREVPEITAYITTPDLDRVEISSSSRFNTEGVETSELSFRASSSSDVTATGLAVDSLDIRGSSSADLALSGSCGYLDASASSSADIVAESLVCTSAEVQASSSGEISIGATGGDVVAYASSSGDVELTGTCAKLTAQASSSGDIGARNMSCADADAKASSGGDITLTASGAVEAKASSGGDITIFGEPASVDRSESSGGDISVRGS